MTKFNYSHFPFSKTSKNESVPMSSTNLETREKHLGMPGLRLRNADYHTPLVLFTRTICTIDYLQIYYDKWAFFCAALNKWDMLIDAHSETKLFMLLWGIRHFFITSHYSFRAIEKLMSCFEEVTLNKVTQFNIFHLEYIMINLKFLMIFFIPYYFTIQLFN